MDPFDDIFAPVPTNARAGGKFQPKVKQRPRNATLAPALSLVPCDNGSELTTLGETGAGESLKRCELLISGVPQNLASENLPAEASGTGEDVSYSAVFDEEPGVKGTGGVQDKEDVHSGSKLSEIEADFGTVDMDHFIDSSGELPSVDVPTTGVDNKVVPDQLSDVGKSAAENVDIFSELDCLDDFVPQTTTDTGNDEIESQSKVDTHDTHVEKFLTSYDTNAEVGNSVAPSEIETSPAEDFSAAHCSIDSAEFTICDVVIPQTDSAFEEVPVDNERSETKAPEILFDFDICEATVASGQHGGKFKPRPNPRKGKDKFSTCIHQAEVGSSLPSEAEHFVSSNKESIHEGPIFELPREDALDHSSARLSDTLGSMHQIQRNEEPPMEATCSQNAILGDLQSEDDPGHAAGQTGPICSDLNHVKMNKRPSSTNGEVEGGKASNQLRKRLGQILDEPVDEVQSRDDPTYEPPSTSNRDEDEDVSDKSRVNATSRKRKAPRKVKEPGNEKSVQKGKRGKKASDESAKETPRKKFSHSSRRNRRSVDKALLDTPEDEIDPQRLPIRDLILLAEHRERMVIKEAAKQKTPQTIQSAGDSFRDDASYEDEMFSSGHGQNSDEDHPRDRVQPTSVFVNYQTYMDKKPGIRWSKLDTELFYEAVRQFGTDFSMIQKLFPNRTRHQVKSKFKREERQHPSRLAEAAMNRAKDHTHFEFVIEQLQQDAAAKQESCANDSLANDGGDEEEAEDANDGATKTEQNDEAVKKQEADVVEVHNSPLKSDKSDEDDEDDLDRWNQYNY